MNRYITVAAGVLLAWSARGAELQVADGGADFGSGMKPVSDRSAKMSLKLPALKTAKPLYIPITAGDDLDSVFTGVLDESKGPGTGYDTLYLDAGNTGNLKEAEPLSLTATNSRQGQRLVSKPVVITARYFEGGERKLPIVVSVYRQSSGKGAIYYSWRNTGHLEGTLAVGSDPEVRIALYDAPGPGHVPNGCFGDYGIDHFRIDLDGDGKLDEKNEDFLLSKVFFYKGKLWNLAVGSSGTDVKVSPCTLAPGKVKIAFKAASGAEVKSGRIKLNSADGYLFVCPAVMKEPLMVPEGVYSLASQDLVVKDATGTNWSLSLSLPAKLSVKAGPEVTVTLGEGVKVEPKISGKFKPGSQVTVEHVVKGAAGEVYEGLSPERGNRAAPAVKITNAAGAVLSQGHMRYG